MISLNKYTCGSLGNSNDVFFTGDLPNYLSLEAVDRNLNLVIKGSSDVIDSLLSSMDTSSINTRCLSANSKRIKDLHAAEITKICNHEDRISDLENSIDFEIGDKTIDINLDCLLPEEEGCEQNPTSFTVQEIIELFISEVCALKSEIDPMSCGHGTSGNSGTSGDCSIC